jgi:Tfp pilus assembly protein PilN
MALVVGGLTFAVIGWDVISSEMAKAAAQTELENQKKIAAELEVIIKEQADLEAKIKNIDTRITAIKKLRDSQAGPSAVLTALRDRIGMAPGLYLESVDQKGDLLTITGNSPSEGVVTDFGRSLEFSGGLFSNLNIETNRKEVTSSQVSTGSAQPSAAPTELQKVETINFTIKCSYTPSKASNGGETQTAANNVPGAPVTPQVAKNQ